MADPSAPNDPQQRQGGGYDPEADRYFQAGFQPLPCDGKTGIPGGYTGRNGRLVSRADVITWAMSRPNANIALRANGWIGLDVDNYRKGPVEKHGWHTLQLAERRWGALPPTWRVTAREQTGASGIRFYRVPDGFLGWATQIRLPDENGQLWSDIEIIQWHHRYAVVAPSIHPDLGIPYRWYDPRGMVSLAYPTLDELPWLPEAWCQGLAEGGVGTAEVELRAPVSWAAQNTIRELWAPRVDRLYLQGTEACQGAVGSRHDSVLPIVGSLTREEEQGSAGASSAIEALGQVWLALVGREGEYERMKATSERLVAGTPSRRQWEAEAVAQLRANLKRYTEAPPQPVAPPTIDPEAEDPFPAAVFGVWRPADVRPYLDPDWRPEEPTLFAREDGKALWYRSNVNWLYGASGSGKTWVALMAAVQEMRAGRHVTWVHYEDPLPDKLVHRLKLLGASDGEIIERFHVLVVGTSMVGGMPFLRPVNAYYASGLLVIDSIGEAIGADGIAVKDDERFTAWIHGTVRVLAADGLSVLGIDHLPMGDPERLDPVGSFRKKAAVTGAMFLAQAPKPFTQTQAGYLTLTCAKDRSGVWARGQVAATVHLRPGDDSPLAWSVVGPIAEGSEGDAGAEPELILLARKIYRELERAGQPMKRDGLMARLALAVRARDSTKRKALNLAIEWGWVIESVGPGRAKMLSIGVAPGDEREVARNV
jgi:hypothetical protein